MTLPKLTPQQYQEITRHRYGLHPARPTDVPKITKSSYGYVLIRWQRFDAWNAWQDKGKPTPRPSNVWTVVPKWDGWTPWDLRKELLAARPHPLPPAPTPPQPPVPPLPAHAARYQNVAVCGQNPMDALQWHGCKIWFTADPNSVYGQWVTEANGQTCRDQGHEVGVWYVPDQIPHSRAQEAARILGTDLIVCDCETLNRFNLAVANGVRGGICNLTDLWQDSRANKMISDGEFIAMNEFYWNQSKHRQPDNHNLPVPSLCIAVYDGHSDSQEADAWEPHVPDYTAAGYMWDSISVYSVNMTANDWASLPKLNQ